MTTTRQTARHLTTSERGRAFITDWEGRHLKAYKDVAGIWTIGVGHTGDEVYQGQIITEAHADQLLRVDLFEAEREIHECVKVPLAQHEFDALVSWEFNCGSIRSSTLLKRLNAERYDLVDDEMRRWNKATNPNTGKKEPVRGLTSRRLSESELWATGDYRTRNESTPFWESNVVPDVPPVKEADKPAVAAKDVQGGVMTGVGVVGGVIADATQQVQGVVQYSDTLRTVFVILTVAGVLLTAYASFKRRRER